MLEILPNIVDGFTANLLAYAVLLAAIATITMALLELVKALPVINARLRYHRTKVSKWVGPAYGELLVLSVSEVESADALFDQPTDKMMGQLQAAANVALDFPDLYPKFYAFLTRPPVSEAAEEEAGMRKTTGSADDASVWRDYSKELDEDRRSTDELPPGAQHAMRARARLDHFVTRKLDAFQTRTEYNWARWNQFTAFLGCVVFILLVLQRSGLNFSLLNQVILATFGGMLAPVAKDVVTALTGLRARA